MNGCLWVEVLARGWVVAERALHPFFSPAPQGEGLFRQVGVSKWAKCFSNHSLGYKLVK